MIYASIDISKLNNCSSIPWIFIYTVVYHEDSDVKAAMSLQFFLHFVYTHGTLQESSFSSKGRIFGTFYTPTYIKHSLHFLAFLRVLVNDSRYHRNDNFVVFFLCAY